MHGKLLLGLVHLLFGAALAWMFFGSADKRRTARVLDDGRVEFTRNRLAVWVWPLIIILVARSAIMYFAHNQGLLERAMAVYVGWLALVLFFLFPGTVVVTNNGLDVVYWFWRNKSIQWKDIVEINTGEKNYTVTVTGADGTKIVHSSQLADRPRFLLELKQHCGENLPPDFPNEHTTPHRGSLRIWLRSMWK